MTAGFPLTSIGSAIAVSGAAVVRGVTGAAIMTAKALAQVPSVIRAYFNRGPVMRMLEMDDRMLRDIGLMRGDITASLAGPLSSDPSTRLRILAVERRAGLRAQARERLTETQRLQTEAQLNAPQRASGEAIECE